jgi:xanthine dehydrogenase accessory factor
MGREIQDIIAAFERRPNEPFALATLVRARGSSYRRPGARLLIARDGLTTGALSGGCLEEEVARRAQEVIASGRPLLLSFDTRLRYGCNGAIDIFIEKIRPQFLDALGAARRAREEICLATNFLGEDSLGSRVLLAQENISAEAFVQTITPPVRLIVVGEGPETATLRDFTRTLGWELHETEEPEILPNEFDKWTAALVKTHNYGRDFVALQKLFPLGLRYVALLGPRRRRDQLLHALAEAGVPFRSELFAPAGLDLGAESPEEIALAIVAEIQAAFAEASVGSLRERKAPIHLVRDLAVA